MTGLSVICALPQGGPDAGLVSRWQALLGQLRVWEQQYHRAPGAVRLVAVSKGFGVAHLRPLVEAGQVAFGENYLSEARPKLNGLMALPLEWHYLGPVQGGQCAELARRFAWVHGVDRAREAERLAAARDVGAPLNVCIQVNVGGESSKAGVVPEAALALALRIAALPRVRLRGLMCIPPQVAGLAAQRRPLRVLAEVYGQLRDRGFELDTLSMGMSDDLEAAVAEGATVVRVGTALFGPRPPTQRMTARRA